MEDVDLVTALAGCGDMKPMINRLEQLAIDAAALAVELQMFALPEIEKTFDMSRADLAMLITDVDPQCLPTRVNAGSLRPFRHSC
jgi:hypothetical protein